MSSAADPNGQQRAAFVHQGPVRVDRMIILCYTAKLHCVRRTKASNVGGEGGEQITRARPVTLRTVVSGPLENDET